MNIPGPAECAKRLNTASPSCGLSRVKSSSRNCRSQKPYLLAKYAAIAPPAGPGAGHPLSKPFQQLKQLIFLAFSFILLHEADSATDLPFTLPPEPDFDASDADFDASDADFDASDADFDASDADFDASDADVDASDADLMLQLPILILPKSISDMSGAECV